MGYAIFIGKRQYIPRVWDTRSEAEKELRDMLVIYPKDSAWWSKFAVQEATAKVRKREEARQKAA